MKKFRDARARDGPDGLPALDQRRASTRGTLQSPFRHMTSLFAIAGESNQVFLFDI